MKCFKRIVVLLLLVALSSSCSKIKEIHLTSWAVESYTPVGFRGLDLVLKLGVDNPALQFTVYDVEAELFRHGKSLGTFVTTDPVTVKPRTVAEYSLKGQARLSDGVSLFSVLALMKNFNMAEYSISYSASVKIRGGGHVTLRKKDVPLNELFEEVEI